MDFLASKKIPLEKIAAIATDEAASMVGKKSGFVSRLKQVCPWIVFIHCLAH